MNRLASISASPNLREYAQGVANGTIMPVANFLAPTVEVATSVGRYKVYSQKNRFRIPDTLRTLGGRASEIKFEATDATYNCEPHALDYPVDNLEQIEEAQLENVMREGADSISEIACLDHERSVVTKALETVGAGTNKTWNSSADPIADIDAAILQVIKSCKYGSLMRVGVLYGASAWNVFKNQQNVRSRFIVGSGGKTGIGLAVATEDIAGQLFIGNPDVRTSYMVYDTAPEGKDEAIQFLLDSTILIFARKDAPTRRDPSFMKTFRLRGQYMVPGSYTRDDGRVEVAKFDWSEDVKVCNSAACIRLNIATA
ncbi:MAG: hypothetical protein NTY53_24875 [Kiritimatiellaeota bacterium]|nr:hypothetical protein [Kiritimatiellota bacterium]